VLKRRDDYWQMGEDGQPLPYLDEIIYVSIDKDAAIAALQSGQVDTMFQPRPSDWQALKDNPDVTVQAASTSQAYLIRMRVDMEPWSDVRVRQAMMKAQDRQKILQLGYYGEGDLSIDAHVAPAHPEYCEKPIPEYDPEGAKALLAEAGYPDGQGFPKTELWLRQADHFAAWQIPAASYLQAHFKKVLGVEIIPRMMESKTYTDAVNQKTHNLFLMTYMFDYMDPSNFMDLFITGGRHAWSNTEYDNLTKEAGSLQDWDQRIENYRKAEKILVQDAPAVFIFQPIDNAVWKPFIHGVGVEPNKEGRISWSDMWNRYILSHIYISEQ